MITTSIIPSSQEEAIDLLEKALSKGDLAEIRIDLVKDLNLLELSRRFDKKRIIVTNRKKDEGGLFEGNESQRILPLIDAIKIGFGFVDIEFSSIDSLDALLLKKREFNSDTNVIGSYHNFEDTPSNLNEILSEVKNKGQDIIKIVTFANDISDNLIIRNLLLSKKDGNKKIISFLMGERGEVSRVLCCSWGSFTSYAPLKNLAATAPGQIPIEILKDVYRVNSINEKFDIYGLVGNPVKESIGYYVHNKLFSYYNIDAVYLNFLVDDINKFMSAFKNQFKGLCVTMPFKEKVIPYLDTIDQMALKIGAINTIKVTKEGLLGTNTDWIGAVYSIEKMSQIKNKKVLILGAGGAGKAIAFGIANRQGQILISNRDPKKAVELSEKIGGETILWEDRNKVDFDILINATKIGMAPEENSCPMEDSFFERDLSGITVFDAVYSPIFTKLLLRSKKQGAKISNGLDMYIGQAMAQFELWTGIKPSHEETDRFSREAIKLRG
ncbi:MAG: Shikimate dehydrogenase [Candidatus Methanofastidiosum methylothiophilum]|uniref:Multifunctional fusion protein n=1 Tax=Candidatus Methanofastidiosum methylothiophilum TaxID=1705564 RepID=A0A150II42_9EURY|nr:MAG: Shikimate dehydrogenase [Candidatus Methanofastidiosum methylthiophilus]KYC46780.1 MAG: Shikimate dehydrogenase [Candidatus Methanofastidiosum methylthiophilus]KYC49207.1 MAG: Shikimate dehydrogenase [Candidatus Methanofastidiosum methylthiophilus]